jgi:hypothetical protein
MSKAAAVREEAPQRIHGGGSYPSGAAAQSTPSHGGSSVAASSRNYPGAAKSASGDLHARHGKTMTPEQRQERIAFIKDHRERGYRWNQIAALLDMRPNALSDWWKWNTQTKFDPKPPTQERKCLCCGDQFESEGPGNRLCPRCRAQSHVLSPYAPDPGGDLGKRVTPRRNGRRA